MPAHRTPTHESMSQRGMSLIYIIGALVALGAIATGVTVFTPSSTMTEVYENNYLRAYYLSLSGIRAWPLLKSGLSDNTTYTYTIGSDKFTLSNSSIDTASGKYTVVSIGTAAAGTAQEANCRLTAKLSDQSGTDEDMVGNVLSSKFDTIGPGRTAEDISPNKNDGQLDGTSSNAVRLVEGVIGNAFRFSCGRNARVVYSGISAYNIFSSGSITLWFKADNFSSTSAALLRKGGSSTTEACDTGTVEQGSRIAVLYDSVYSLQFWPATDGVYLRFHFIDGAQNDASLCTWNNWYNGYRNYHNCVCAGSDDWKTATVYSKKIFKDSDIGEWFFVAVTWQYDNVTKKTVFKLYINGKLDNSETVSEFVPRTNDAPIVIGGQGDSDYLPTDWFFCGSIDEPNVYNSALQYSSIKKYYCSNADDSSVCN